jgi:hypothetical protein
MRCLEDNRSHDFIDFHNAQHSADTERTKTFLESDTIELRRRFPNLDAMEVEEGDEPTNKNWLQKSHDPQRKAQ